MLHSEIGIPILNGLFGHAKGTSIMFTGEVYLGLLTKLPNVNDAAHEDGTYFTELSSPDYQRIRVDTNSRINKKYIMGDAENTEAAANEDGDMVVASRIRNQAAMIFAENTVLEMVAGFGLFRSGDKTDQTLPFLWGEVSGLDGTNSIFLDAEEVPIVREGGFEISFM